MKHTLGSVWSETTTRIANPALDGDITTDVLVVGGGICGILVAHRLKELGLPTVVVEAKTIGSGITKNTAANILSPV